MNINLIKTDSYMPCKAVAHMSQVLSYTNNTKQAIDHTRPAFLIPGIDLVGISRTRIQQTFKNRALSAFGMFDVRSIPLFDLRTR